MTAQPLSAEDLDKLRADWRQFSKDRDIEFLLAAVEARDAEIARLREALIDVRDGMGESLHTALRKTLDSKAATAAWSAIDELPNEEWAAALAVAFEWCVDPDVFAALGARDAE